MWIGLHESGWSFVCTIHVLLDYDPVISCLIVFAVIVNYRFVSPADYSSFYVWLLIWFFWITLLNDNFSVSDYSLCSRSGSRTFIVVIFVVFWLLFLNSCFSFIWFSLIGISWGNVVDRLIRFMLSIWWSELKNNYFIV